MEYFPAGISSLRQLYPDAVHSNISSIGHHLLNQYIHKTEEVTCPEPRRIIGKQIPGGTHTRLYSKQKSFVSRPKWEASEIVDIILSHNDDPETDPGFLHGSPPIRAGNPLIFNSNFEKEIPPLSDHFSLYKVERETIDDIQTKRLTDVSEDKRQMSSCSGSPRVRVEGFSPVSAMA